MNQEQMSLEVVDCPDRQKKKKESSNLLKIHCSKAKNSA